MFRRVGASPTAFMVDSAPLYALYYLFLFAAFTRGHKIVPTLRLILSIKSIGD